MYTLRLTVFILAFAAPPLTTCAPREQSSSTLPWFVVDIADAEAIAPGDPVLCAEGYGAGRVKAVKRTAHGAAVTFELLPGDCDPELRVGDWIAVDRGGPSGRELQVVHGDSTLPLIGPGGKLRELPADSIAASRERWNRKHAEVMRALDSMVRADAEERQH